MEVKAIAKNIRMSAKKARLVVDVIRGKHVEDALSQLMFINKRAVGPIQKVLNSAIANAENNFNLNRKDLIVRVAKVDEGFTLKRWMPRAFGRATPIRKRACHITVAVGLPKGAKNEEALVEKKVEQKAEKPEVSKVKKNTEKKTEVKKEKETK